MDYRETLNLPQTEFPMKAELSVREPAQQVRWQEMDIYAMLRREGKGKHKFILHDGPPYANGDVHIGTAFNKISKDIIIRYKSMRGFDTPYIPGWDCHGMPIEHKVVEKLSAEEKADSLRVRTECRLYAGKYIQKQREQFKRLGIFGDWEKPYLTMDPKYQAAIVKAFGELAVQGYIYRGLKPVYWCTDCRSALAEAEVEYLEHASPSITVRFELGEGWPEGLGDRPGGRIFIPIWTTTPWTLPANRAVAVHPDLTYALVESEGDYYILARKLVESNWEAFGRPYALKAEISGEALDGLRLQHPFLDISVPVITGTHVTMDSGTGCVHTAPGHGQEDYFIGRKYGLEVYNPVGPDGCFTSDFSEMQGELVFNADPKIIDILRERGALMRAEEIRHAYPHCWRHHTPVIFRATEQWFLNVNREGFRERLLEHINQEVVWIPEASRNRMAAMVKTRPDWCLSRQRVWGVPVPIFYCQECGEPLICAEAFKAVENLIAAESADAWFCQEPETILPAGTHCPQCQARGFRRETDILDVWFDSGVSHAAVLNQRPELKFPADLYLEGTDQHRGWFQVSLLTAEAMVGRAPYRAVLTHGYAVDGEGRKMSKSLGNFITAEEAVARYGGADIMRLWVASENIQNDVRFSDEILKRTIDAYRRIRNTLRFLLGNLHGFAPAQALNYKDLEPLDQLMLHRLQEFISAATHAFEAYEVYRFYQVLQNFCAADLSAFYFDILKDRLYTDGRDSSSRRSAQTVLWHLLRHLARLMAPVLVHIAEETWTAMIAQGLHPDKEAAPSVHLAAWLPVPKEWHNAALAQTWDALLQIRMEVLKKLEEARNQKMIRHPYEALVRIRVRGEHRSRLAACREQLPAFFVVSAVEIQDAGSAGPAMLIQVERAPGNKCERCWRVLPKVGQHQDYPGLCDRCHAVICEMIPPKIKKEMV